MFDLRFRLRVRFRIRRMNIILNTMYMIWYKICTGYIIYTTYDSSPPSCGLLVEINQNIINRGPPRLGLTKLLTSGRRGFIYAR